MRYIKRLPEPQILSRKKAIWTDSFIKSTKDRPDNNKYGHKTILNTLQSCSFHKCFYCEKILKSTSKEIDHFIEVAERKDLAFCWENLYLSCENCNKKIPNITIPVDQVLDPCKDDDNEIKKHINFDYQTIISVNDSPKGLFTIQKYRLDTEHLDYLRSLQLLKICKLISMIEREMRRHSRQDFTEDEKEKLKSFTYSHSAYSIMAKTYLQIYYPEIFR